MRAVQAASEYTISWRLFQAARGNLHGISPDLKANHDTKNG